MDLSRDVFDIFDVDGDGEVDRNEWPYETIDEPFPSFYYADVDELLRIVDGSKFDDRRPELWRFLVGRTDTQKQRVRRELLEQLVARAANAPLSDVSRGAAPPGFLARWDLDGDGAVTPQEHREFPRVAARCDRNGDGRIDAKDAGR